MLLHNAAQVMAYPNPSGRRLRGLAAVSARLARARR